MIKYKKIKIVIFLIIFSICIFFTTQICNADEIVDKEIIEEGEYRILSAQDNNKVFDIVGGYRKSGTLLELWDKNYGMNQTFYLKRYSDNSYEIIARHSNLSLDVYGNEKKEGTAVEQYYSNGQNNQRWFIKKADDNYYNIISKASGLCLDINTGNVRNGSLIQIYNKNNSITQKFLFEKINNEIKPEKTIDDGVYQIKMFSNPDFCLDIGSASQKNGVSVGVWKNNKAFNQRFIFQYDNDGYYSIKALHSNLCLDVFNGDILNGTDVIQWKENNGTNQKWILHQNDDGSFYIVSKGNELFLNVANNSNFYGANINTSNKLREEKYRKFIIEKIDFKNSQKVLEDGTYQLISTANRELCLDVEGASKSNGANIELWKNNKAFNQKFRISYIDGYYRIQAEDSGKVLDVHGAGFVGGTNVEQYSSNNGDNQKWIIEKTDEGYYKIVSKCNELYLTTDSTVKYGSNVYVGNEKTGIQDFIIQEIEVIPEGTYKIRTSLNNNTYFDVEGYSNADNANISLYNNCNQKNQMFSVKYVNDNYFKLVAVNSGLVLTNLDGNLVQKKDLEEESQLWKAERDDSGQLKLKNKFTDKYIIIEGNGKNGDNVGILGDKNSGTSLIFEDITKGVVGSYGKSGLYYQGDSRGQDLKYYKYGCGENVYFATFTVHGFEDNWNWDGWELQWIANNFYNKLVNDKNEVIAKNWTIFIFPTVNPDGLNYGTGNNGPGRTTFYSSSPTHQGIDINRCWQTDSSYKTFTTSRNYNGTSGFQAYEAAALRDFLLNHKSTTGRTILVDLHGWENSLIGSTDVLTYFANYFPDATKKYESYGQQYMITWGRNVLGAQVGLVELPTWIGSHNDVVNADLSGKYINSCLNMLNGISVNNRVNSTPNSDILHANLGSNKSNSKLEEFGIATAGAINKGKPTLDQVNDYKNLEIDSGVYIIPGYEDGIIGLINSVANNEYGINDNNYLILVSENANQNKYDIFLNKLIDSNNSYLISSLGELYFKDELTNEIVSNIYEFMDGYQTYDYAEYENKMLIDIPKNNDGKLKNTEIMDSLIELIKE